MTLMCTVQGVSLSSVDRPQWVLMYKSWVVLWAQVSHDSHVHCLQMVLNSVSASQLTVNAQKLGILSAQVSHDFHVHCLRSGSQQCCLILITTSAEE